MARNPRKRRQNAKRRFANMGSFCWLRFKAAFPERLQNGLPIHRAVLMLTAGSVVTSMLG